MEDLINKVKLKPIDFIPLVGLCTYGDRISEARVEAFVEDFKNRSTYEINGVIFGHREDEVKMVINTNKFIIGLYHSAFILGIVLSPLIYKGLENLLK